MLPPVLEVLASSHADLDISSVGQSARAKSMVSATGGRPFPERTHPFNLRSRPGKWLASVPTGRRTLKTCTNSLARRLSLGRTALQAAICWLAPWNPRGDVFLGKGKRERSLLDPSAPHARSWRFRLVAGITRPLRPYLVHHRRAASRARPTPGARRVVYGQPSGPLRGTPSESPSTDAAWDYRLVRGGCCVHPMSRNAIHLSACSELEKFPSLAAQHFSSLTHYLCPPTQAARSATTLRISKQSVPPTVSNLSERRALENYRR